MDKTQLQILARQDGTCNALLEAVLALEEVVFLANAGGLDYTHREDRKGMRHAVPRRTLHRPGQAGTPAAEQGGE